MAVNEVTNKIYVANQGGADVTVIDGTNNDSVITTIKVGISPTFMVVNPNTNKTYVVNLGSNSVTVIDGRALTVPSVSRAISRRVTRY